jgi:lysophospholipase L1-like esterase
MGMTTPTAVAFVKSEVALWRPSVIVYDSMANDLTDPDRPGMIAVSPAKVATYESRLRDLAAFCAEQDIALVFWANTIAQRGDPLKPFRRAMERVAADSGSGYVDLGALYLAAPATGEETAEFLAEPNWTQWFDVVHPPELPLERIALHIDWVHPNRFGSQRLADGLLPLVEEALSLTAP